MLRVDTAASRDGTDHIAVGPAFTQAEACPKPAGVERRQLEFLGQAILRAQRTVGPV